MKIREAAVPGIRRRYAEHVAAGRPWRGPNGVTAMAAEFGVTRQCMDLIVKGKLRKGVRKPACPPRCGLCKEVGHNRRRCPGLQRPEWAGAELGR